jgi:hypothetical protein
VGEINLASAYVHERNYEQAETLLEKLERDTQRENLPALYGNTLERMAELAIISQNGCWQTIIWQRPKSSGAGSGL